MIGDKIRERRNELGMKQSELSKLTGIKSNTISNYENGVSTPNEHNLYRLMDALKCDANYLFEWDDEIDQEIQLSKDEKNIIRKYRFIDKYGKEAINDLLNTEYNRCKAQIIEIPMYYGKVSAGDGKWLEEPDTFIVSVRATPEAFKADMVLTVSGNSMEPRYSDGDVVFVKKQADIEVGEIGIFIVDNSAFIKQKGIGELISINPIFDNIKGNEFSDSRCFGKVLGVAEIIYD